MDHLDRLVEPAIDLLGRVDAALAAGGAPAGHPVWPLLRRVGAPPGDVFAFVAAASPQPLLDAAERMRPLADGYAAGYDRLARLPDFAGGTADVVRTQAAALAAHLGGGPDSLAGRVAGTAALLEEVAGWLRAARDRMAVAAARCLGSADAVTVRAAGPGGTGLLLAAWLAADSPQVRQPAEVCRAAARIAVEILTAGGAILHDGHLVADRWAGRLDELPYRGPAAGDPGGHRAAGRGAVPGSRPPTGIIRLPL